MASHRVASHRVASHRVASHHVASHHVASHRVASHRVASHHVASHHVALHRVASHHVASHRVASHRVASHRVASHHVASHRVASHHVASHHVTSHHVTSRHVASHHVASHHVASHHVASHRVAQGPDGAQGPIVAPSNPLGGPSEVEARKGHQDGNPEDAGMLYKMVTPKMQVCCMSCAEYCGAPVRCPIGNLGKGTVWAWRGRHGMIGMALGHCAWCIHPRAAEQALHPDSAGNPRRSLGYPCR